MLKVTLSLVLVLVIGGCTTSTPVPAAFGSFIQTPNTSDEKAMVDDAIKKLTAVFPPARTRFNLQHATPDAFGTDLVTALRAKGYALAEVKPGTQVAPAAGGEQTLAYIVDQPLEPGLYRVTFIVNNQSLSRVYQSANGTLSPAGAWVRKE